jgi:hypothetical protein
MVAASSELVASQGNFCGRISVFRRSRARTALPFRALRPASMRFGKEDSGSIAFAMSRILSGILSTSISIR